MVNGYILKENNYFCLIFKENFIFVKQNKEYLIYSIDNQKYRYDEAFTGKTR